MQLVVDKAIFRADTSLLTVLAIGFGLLILVQAIIEALRAWALQVFGQLLSFQMIGNLVRHMLKLPSDWFEKRHVGDIMSRNERPTRAGRPGVSSMNMTGNTNGPVMALRAADLILPDRRS